MCRLCVTDANAAYLARRAYALSLLELLECPNALPADAALRLAREIIVLTQAEETTFRCEPVGCAQANIGDSR